MPEWWTRAHTEAALWICAAIVAGEIGGLIVGGIREVWIHVHAAR